MQASEGCLQLYSITYNILPSLAKTKNSRNTSPSFPLKNINLNQERISSNNSLSHVFFKKRHQGKKTPVNEASHQVKNCLSLIEDPLWKSICAELASLAGPFFVQKIWDSKLGSFSHRHKTMNLYCQTEDTAQFINQYSFLILGSLQRYFPMIKDLKIIINQAL